MEFLAKIDCSRGGHLSLGRDSLRAIDMRPRPCRPLCLLVTDGVLASRLDQQPAGRRSAERLFARLGRAVIVAAVALGMVVGQKPKLTESILLRDSGMGTAR